MLPALFTLAFYAGWSEYKGTEFAEYLELAGDMGLDAASVVKLLENPGEHHSQVFREGSSRRQEKEGDGRA